MKACPTCDSDDQCTNEEDDSTHAKTVKSEVAATENERKQKLREEAGERDTGVDRCT